MTKLKSNHNVYTYSNKFQSPSVQGMDDGKRTLGEILFHFKTQNLCTLEQEKTRRQQFQRL